MSKRQIVDRLEEAALDTERFVQCQPGEKGCLDHTLLSAEDVSGVYGVYVEREDPLVWVDIDDYEDIEDKSGLAALMRLPSTLEQKTPHGGTHRAYKVVAEDDRPVADVLEDEFGRANLQPSWGDLRVYNGYVVGAGSVLDGCDKDGHDCSEEGEGHYELETDREIAEVPAQRFVEIIRQDPVYEEAEQGLSDVDVETDGHPEPETVLAYALNDSDDDKLRRLWRGDYSDYGGDRSRAESALAFKLAFWLRGDKQAVRRAMDGEIVPGDVSPPRLEKWEEREDDSYRDSVLEAVDRKTDYFEPAHHGQEDADNDPAPRSPDASSADEWFGVQLYYDDEQTDPSKARQQAVDKLLEEFDYATPMDTETVWVYDPELGIYEPTGQNQIRETLAEKLGPHYSNHEKNEIIEKVRARTFIERDEFDAGDNDNLICVGNGVLDLESRELMEHSPDYYFTRGVEWEYDPDATAPKIESFIESLVKRDVEKQTLFEMIGAALSPRYEQAKFLIAFGEGSNGKSTFFELVEELLGDANVSGWDLQDLSDNRFASSDLVGKFANVAPDMPGRKLKEVGTLKKLTGDDITMAEKKNQDAFELKNTATMMFGANRPPAIPESSRAVKRRIVPIRFPYEFTAADDDNPDKRVKEELMAELTTEEEMSGFLNLALDGLERLRAQGDVSLPEDHDERLEYYEQFSDPIKEFRVNCLETATGTREKKSSIYDAYTRFCHENNYDPSSSKVFWKQLRQTTLTVDASRPEIEGSRVRVLNGVKFTEDGLNYAPASVLSEESNPDQGGMEENATPLSDIDAGTDSGEYVSVTVEVEKDPKTSGLNTENRPVVKAQARDETGEATVVTWAEHENAQDPDAPLSPWPAVEQEAPNPVYIESARVDEYEGDLQLVLEHGTTGTTEIQTGVGHTPPAPTEDEDQEDLDTAADGGSASAKGRVHEHLSREYDHNDTFTVARLTGELDMEPGPIERAVDALAEQGEVVPVGDGEFRYD